MNAVQEALLDERYRLFGSLLDFTQVFYRLRTGRRFELSEPIGRESHFISIARALTRVIDGELTRLIINVPPRYGKTELLINFVSWALAQYPDSNFIYVSYSHSLAKKQTQTIRSIINMPDYRNLFDVMLKDDTSAKDNFEVIQGGSIYAVGAGGSITGRGAGINNSHRFGGCIVIDDIIKPDEATSDTIREGINEWYYNTLQSRLNSPNTPIIFIGQRVHEDDLAANLIKTEKWETVTIPALDEVGNALYPNKHNAKLLREMQEESPYNFAAQYQQEPQPAGGGIFKPEWFYLHEHEPDILETFITCDTAETDKDYNDATVFSFWGIYWLLQGEMVTDIAGLHWIDCREVRIEPKDLQNEFFSFYRKCMMHKKKPSIVAIEKKSTGVTLASSLRMIQGLNVLPIERTRSSGNKTNRFLEIQPYVASSKISFPTNGTHTQMCIEHCRKITANDTHAHDDIADTLYDAVKLALIDKVIEKRVRKSDSKDIARSVMSKFAQVQRIKDRSYTEMPSRNIFK